MSVLDTVFGEVDSRHENTRAAMRVKAGSVGAESIIASSAGGPFGSGLQSLTSAAEQYRAASKGYQFTAIRPIAVKAADQMMRVGVRAPKSMSKRRRNIGVWRKLHGEGASLIEDCPAYRHEQILGESPKWIKSMRQDIDVVDEHVALAAFEDPNPYMTQWALMYCTVFSLEATGEALWVLDPQPDGLVHIWYIPRSWAKPIHKEDELFVSWKITPPGSSDDIDPIPAELVCHFQYPNPGNPMAGHSALSAQAYAVNTDDEIQRSQFHLVRNMQRPSMLITLGEMVSPEGKKGGRPELSETQRKEMIQSVRRHYMEATKFGDPLVLDRLVHDVKPYMPGLTDLDFENGGKVTKDRIMQGIGVNPIVTGDTENANRASAWVAHESVNQMKVNPILTLIGQTLTKKLPLIVQDATLIIWFDDAKAKDPDLILKRVSVLATNGGIKVGELREFAATGDFENTPTDKDDEWVKGKADAPKSAQPGEKPGEEGGGGKAGLGKEPPDGADGSDVEEEDEKASKGFDPYTLFEAIEYGKSLSGRHARESMTEMLQPPPEAVRSARRVLKWAQTRDLDVDDATIAIARELSTGQPVASGTVAKMAEHASQRDTYAIARYKCEDPSSDGDIVAWLAMGGSKGIRWAKNCGTGSGGFKPGNVCAKGGSGVAKAAPGGSFPKTTVVKTDDWPKHNSAAKWGAKKIAKMEAMAASNDIAGLKAMDTVPKSSKPNKYQQAVHAAHKKLLKQNDSDLASLTNHGSGGSTSPKPGGLSDSAKAGNPHAHEMTAKSITGEFADVSNWKSVGGQLGSNSGGQMESKDGQKYYVKFMSEDRARNEYVAGKLYRAAGANVPTLTLIKKDGKTGIASRWEDTVDVDQSSSSDMASVQEDFATHAWLGNWDAAGMTFDNVKMYPAGDKKLPMTVDVGGSLKYRAQGSLKGADWNDAANEWVSMRDPSKNQQTAKLFGSMTPSQLANSAKRVSAVSDEKIKNIVEKYGGGTKTSQKQLTERLIKRRQSIVDRAEATVYSEAYAKASAAGLSSSQAIEAGKLAAEKLAIKGAHYYEASKKKAAGSSVSSPSAAMKSQFKKAQEKVKADKAKLQSDAASEAVEAVKSGKSQDAWDDLDPVKKATGVSTKTAPTKNTSAPSVPPPPQFNTPSNPGVQKKFDALYEAASKGDIAAVESIKTNANAKQNYAKKAHQYKMQILESLGQGGTVSPAHKPGKPNPAAKKASIKASELPSDPSFVSSNKANVTANEKAVSELKSLAMAGDIDGIKAHKGTPSPKVQEYKMQLAQSVHEQLNPPPAPKPFSGAIHDLHLAAKAKVIHGKKAAKAALERIGRYVALETVGLPKGLPKAGTPGHSAWETSGDNSWKPKTSGPYSKEKHVEAWNALPDKERQALKNYTNGGYSAMTKHSAGLSTGTAAVKTKTANALRGLSKAAQELGEGTVIYRKHSLPESDKAKILKSVGRVMQDPGPVSTSFNSTTWGGDVHWRFTSAKGAKGLFVAQSGMSNHPSEKEIILPGNSRYLITAAKKSKGGNLLVDAVLLPYYDGQEKGLPGFPA